MRCGCEEPEIYREKIVKAPRKTFKCCECGYVMPPGYAHQYTYAVMDGTSYQGRTCISCLSLKAWVEAHIPCVCWYMGDLLQQALDVCSDYATEADCPSLLSECTAMVNARIADAKSSRQRAA
jgi:hypothetical protein